MGEDGAKIAIEIKHFSHKHDLKLTNEVPNNIKCNGCERDILPPIYCCTQCNFFLHKSCVELPKIKRQSLHRHPLTLNYWSYSFWRAFYGQECNGLRYNCQLCNYDLNVQCSLISNTLTHACHKYCLFTSPTQTLNRSVVVVVSIDT